MKRFIIICAIVLTAAPVAAFAQAGSTGGTIGKQDKSASGGEVRVPKQERRAPVARKHYVVVREQRVPRARKHHVSEAAARTSQPATRPQTTGRTRCGKLVGVWAWYNNVEVTVLAGGSMSASNGDSGTWTCTDGQVVFNWRMAQDRVRLSTDGKRLTGSNTLGTPISNSRK